MSSLDSNFNANFTSPASPIGGIQDKYTNLESGYAGAIAGQATAPQLVSKYNDQFGIPQMQQNIQQGNETYDMLGSNIRAIPKNIAQGSQESILTNGQKQRMVNVQQAPLIDQQNQLGQNLSRMGQNLGTAQTNANQMISAEQVQQAKELQPWTQKFSDEQVVSAMQMTGWSTENANELSVLLANQQAGVTQSEGEKNRMNQLAQLEKTFENNLKLNTQQAGINKDAYNYSHPDPLGLGF